MRARVLCRCVCGWEQMVWLGNIQRGRSIGCRVATCRHRWEATRALRRDVTVKEPGKEPETFRVLPT